MTFAVILHVIGTVLGVGGVTMNDLTLLKAIGDGDVGIAYQKNTKWYSLVIWLGLLIIAGSALYFGLTQSWVLQSEKILFKLLLVMILTVNGVLMGMVLAPMLKTLKREDWENKTEKLSRIVKAGIFPGALSITSWYGTLILGAAGRQPWTAGQMLTWYLIALVVAYLGAWVTTTYLLKK